jgi:hypothetical protein
MDPDPAIFVIDLQDASKKLWVFLTQFFPLVTFRSYINIIFSKIKSQKESQNSRIQGFSYYFCMMIEGSGSGSRAGSGSIPLTSGSGSGRPKTRGSGGSGSLHGTVLKVILHPYYERYRTI